MTEVKGTQESKRLSPSFPEASEADYIKIQGGRPKVSKNGELTTVTHDYPGGEGMTVKSHIDHGVVNLRTENGIKQFNVDELRQFHGNPCERQSKKSGGQGYDRKPNG